FFVSCSLQDMIRIYLQKKENSLERFHEKFAVQLNDTHPALAVAELMRLLVDVHAMDWDKAWYVTRQTMSYTNHTLLPEALETYSLPLVQRLLPRHMEIIYQINHQFLDDVNSRLPGQADLSRISIIDEGGDKQVRMANLACVGSHAINGVARLHSDLLKTTVLSDFYHLWPEKFSNKTNGVTPRRFMLLSNPELSALITQAIGDCWITDLDLLRNLEPLADDAGFCNKWGAVKLARKRILSEKIQDVTGSHLDSSSLFDVQTKRIHEYKRQILNVLHILTLYSRIKRGDTSVGPRTFIFGGKAAPGYATAKLTIKLINSVADLINHDPEVNSYIRVIFFPDFNVKSAHYIYPAADLSEQISTAGYEASGTGNMKFALNGALTIGTLDGANVEIREEVGEDNFFLFGLTVEEVSQLRRQGYSPRSIYEQNLDLRMILDLIGSAMLSPNDRTLFHPLLNNLIEHDHFLVLADYQHYIKCQDEVAEAWHDQKKWTRMSILNVARMGMFSSDRAIRQYCEDIWHVHPVPVELDIIQPVIG
ncbi:MAG: glycogen/starch/alpha-glucan family phosphorylase, partial [Candidatus Obscuribacterales bacterium]|nr:glycogen/starch/alpha-glucan family phosphorylase [Candidatus Obscuribacterales bacterium]